MTNSKKVYLLDLDGTLLQANGLFAWANYFYIVKNFFPVLGFKTFAMLALASRLMNRQTKPRTETNYQELITVLRSQSSKDLENPLWNFYRRDFPRLSWMCSPVPGAADAVARLKASGHKLYLTTNPIWPEECVNLRLKWAGFNPDTFEGMTHSQNWRSFKPHLEYYQQVLEHWHLKASDCILIGDSPKKEGPAKRLGIEVRILNGSNAKTFWDNIG